MKCRCFLVLVHKLSTQNNSACTIVAKSKNLKSYILGKNSKITFSLKVLKSALTKRADSENKPNASIK